LKTLVSLGILPNFLSNIIDKILLKSTCKLLICAWILDSIWRNFSLKIGKIIEHQHGVLVVAGSNPVAPTNETL
jgi:hypothetical protein